MYLLADDIARMLAKSIEQIRHVSNEPIIIMVMMHKM